MPTRNSGDPRLSLDARRQLLLDSGFQGLRVIGIHMPRYESDTDVEKVRDLINIHGVSEPVAVDNEHKLKDAFHNDHGYVPAYYLFDAEGKLKSFAAGERGLDMLKSAIERLLPAEEVVVSTT